MSHGELCVPCGKHSFNPIHFNINIHTFVSITQGHVADTPLGKERIVKEESLLEKVSNTAMRRIFLRFLYVLGTLVKVLPRYA